MKEFDYLYFDTQTVVNVSQYKVGFPSPRPFLIFSIALNSRLLQKFHLGFTIAKFYFLNDIQLEKLYQHYSLLIKGEKTKDRLI